MKTKSKLVSMRAPWSAFFAVGAMLLLSSTAIAARNPCRATADLALQATRADATAEYLLSIAKASTLTGEARKAAEQRALVDYRERDALANAQRQERVAVCQLLNETRYNPTINPADFLTPEQTAANPNPYLPLVPGTVYRYEGETAEGLETVEVRVTRQTREILGVTCTVVRDTVRLKGKLIEDTYDWLAQDNQGNVWYFGERVTDFEGGLVSSIDGSFEAGIDGAKPGILMKANPTVGDAYRQEFALTEAEDVAEVLSVNASATVPYGSFRMNCVQTRDFNPLEPDASKENKYYAPGIGNVLNVKVDTGERVELVSVTTN